MYATVPQHSEAINQVSWNIFHDYPAVTIVMKKGTRDGAQLLGTSVLPHDFTKQASWSPSFVFFFRQNTTHLHLCTFKVVILQQILISVLNDPIVKSRSARKGNFLLAGMYHESRGPFLVGETESSH
jgi:hypothetical protein